MTRDTSAATAGRQAAALKRRLTAAAELLQANHYIVIPPCYECGHGLDLHGPSGCCYLRDCTCERKGTP